MLDDYTYDSREVIKQTIKSLFLKNSAVIEFKGGFKDFEEVMNISSGYDYECIFEKSAKAAISVKDGLAKYERDSCLFYDNLKMFELLYAIESTINQEGSANILDFGGGLGSMYFQHRDLLDKSRVKWTIKEQDKFVSFGKEHLSDDVLSFVSDVDIKSGYNLLILGSSLQYIENSKDILKDLLDIQPYMIFIDRTPMCRSGNQELVYGVFQEIVRQPIYDAEYPMYVFNKDFFDEMITDRGYCKLSEWNPTTGGSFRYKNKKIVFESSMWRLK